MRVFIVIQEWKSEDYSNIYGVFSTLEKAYQYKREIEEAVNWNKTKDFYYRISNYVVDEEALA